MDRNDPLVDYKIFTELISSFLDYGYCLMGGKGEIAEKLKAIYEFIPEIKKYPDDFIEVSNYLPTETIILKLASPQQHYLQALKSLWEVYKDIASRI